MIRTSTERVIETAGLTRSYGEGRGIFGLDLQVDRGEIVAVLGPNGAGKTTLVEVLEGLRNYDSGTVSVLGHDPAKASPSWRSRIGAVLQLGTETDEFTVGEMLRAHAAYYPNPRDLGEVIKLLDLLDLIDHRVSTLSGGQRRRVDVALGIVGHPELLFLDEPTTGLDPEVRRTIWDLINRLAQEGTTVLLTSHYLDEVEYLAQRTIVIVEGTNVWEGPTGELTDPSAIRTVRFLLRPPMSIGDLPGGLPPARKERDGHISFDSHEATTQVAALMEWGAKQPGGNPVEDLQITRPSLEDSYLSLLKSADQQKANQ